MDRPFVVSVPVAATASFAPDWAGELRVPYSFADRSPLVARSTDRVEGPAKAGDPRR